MNSDTRITLIVITVMAVYLVAIRLIFWRFLQPLVRKLLLSLTVIEIVWVILHLITNRDKTFFGWFFHPSSEFASGAILNSSLLLAISLICLMLTVRPHIRQGFRLYWGFLAVTFFFLALDEYYSLHETVDLWRSLYAGFGAFVVLSSLLVYWYERENRTIIFLLVGLGFIGFAGVFLDAFANKAPVDIAGLRVGFFYCGTGIIYGIRCQGFGIVEEFLELAGATLILTGCLSYGETNLSAPRWLWTKRLLMAATSIWLVWTVSTFWFVPSLEARLQGEPIDLTYLDGDLSLESYRISRNVAAPGDEFDATFYFQAKGHIPDDYYLSVQVLTHPDVTDVAQADLQLGEWDYPSSAWIPGLVVKNVTHLTLPADLPTPASYWLMVRVWVGPDLAAKSTRPISEQILPAKTSLMLIEPDAAIVFSLPVISSSPVAEPPTVIQYRFADGFTLYGYSMPDTATIGQPITLQFWWKSEIFVGRPLKQFIHLMADGKEEPWVFEQQPFDDKLPFADWPKGLNAVDDWTFTLPDDLPPGEYQILTGVYDTTTIIRVPVTDGHGQAVQNDSIVLGTLTVSAGE
jgi:hypothetical protein